jgi:hypothetical protein
MSRQARAALCGFRSDMRKAHGAGCYFRHAHTSVWFSYRPRHGDFLEAVKPLTASHDSTLMRPAPLAAMSPLFSNVPARP